jgi:hypothetical protein
MMIKMPTENRPKSPTGTFDNLTTFRREIWYDGKLELSHSKEFVDMEQGRGYSFIRMHPWGHFKDLPR